MSLGSWVGTTESNIGKARSVAHAHAHQDARWLRAMESWHGARRRPLPIVLDALTAGVIGGAVSGSRSGGVLCGVILVAAGLVFGLFKPRTSLETQGVAWYPLPLLPTAVAMFVGLGVLRSDAAAWPATLAAAGALLAVRVVLWLIIGAARRRGIGLRPTLVIGPADRTEQVEHRLRTFPEAGLVLEGTYVPALGADRHHPVAGAALVERLLALHHVDQILCVVDDQDEAVLRDLMRFGGERVDCGLVLPVPGIAVPQSRAHLGDLGVIPVRCSPSPGSSLAKRAFDLVVSVLGLIAISPFLALVAAAIKVGDRGPVIFPQTRVGRDGRKFTIYKFRSMIVDAEARRGEHLASNINTEGLLFKLEQDPRITPVGAIIRRFSIDELPQLLNVIKGDMSLVGPRPLPVDPDEFDVVAQIRHKVAPGITGLWQVHGANALRYADMLDLDLAYVATRSLGRDLKLLAQTVPAVVFRRAAY